MTRSIDEDLKKPPLRATILDEAKRLITGDRLRQYGSFRDQMVSIAGAASAITGKHFKPEEIGLILILLKVKRMTTAPGFDSHIDLAGYAALMGEHFRPVGIEILRKVEDDG